MKRPQRADGPTGLEKAIDHPIRRRALRRLNAGGPRGSLDLVSDLGLPLGIVAYHLRLLHLHGAVKVVEDSPCSPMSCYESAVMDDPRITARLIASEAEDEARAPVVTTVRAGRYEERVAQQASSS